MIKEENKPTQILSENLFPVVGVGASAGGLEAFKELIKAIPQDTGMAFILVQHLAPQYESMLSGLLQKVTKIPVLEVTENIKVVPDHIYIIPSNKLMLANDGVLQLYSRAQEEKLTTIDVFFTSLAEIHQEHAIGVILSGTGSDGTVGLKTIKDMGGITIAQDERTAAYYSMPQSAIDADVVDFVLSPSEIPKHLLELVRTSKIVPSDFNTSDALWEEDLFKQILALLRAKRGVDFTYYKQTTIRRRILRRKALNKIEKLKDYKSFLFENKTEQDLLFKDILIPVTAFFRDPKTFAILCETVFSRLFKEKTATEPVRIWIAGCSTGEEAYSMAICLHDYLGDKIPISKIQIFATDISEAAIAKARSGIYQKKDMAGVSETRIKQFFTRIGGSYHVNKAIREMCVFACQNFLKDPPFVKMDLISCRNVLIYMEPYLQKKALTTFHYALNNGGFLFLGKSENIGQLSGQFHVFNQLEKLYTRKAIAAKFMHSAPDNNEAALKRKGQSLKAVVPRKDDFQKAADNALLLKYATVGVIVNEELDILQFRGSTSGYLESPPGKASHNVLKMAKEGLSFELRNALHKAKLANAVTRKEGILLDGGKRKISIEIIPLQNTIESYFLVLFTDETDQSFLNLSGVKRKINKKDEVKLNIELTRIEQLEKELAQAREDMRAITEEQEAANEELQSANEELLSGSEELQSLNEELETTKEEVQSSNEELTILNQELIERNEQLIHSHKYAEAVVTTIHEPLIILTSDFRVKSANKSFYETFNETVRQTEGKMFFELGAGKWSIPGLHERLQKILPERSFFENFEVSLGSPFNGERVMVLNGRQLLNESSNEQLILLAIQDITERKEIERQIIGRANEMAKQRQLLYDFFMDAPAILGILKGADHVCELANPLFQKILGNRNPVGKCILDAMPELEGQGIFAILDKVFQTGESFAGNEMAVSFGSLNGAAEPVFVSFMFQATRNTKGDIDGVFIFGIDVTEQVMARKSIEVQKTMFQNMIIQAPAFAATFMGPDHIYTLINPSYQKLFGNRNLTGKKLTDAAPEFESQSFIKQLDRVYKTGEVYVGNEVLTYITTDGGQKPQPYYFNLSLQPIFDEVKNIDGVLAFGYDVTKQVLAKKQNEENLRTILESTHQIAWTATPDGNINYYNSQFYKYTGMTFEKAKDKGWESLIDPDQREEVIRLWEEAVNSGLDFYCEMLIRRADQLYRWHVCRASPVKNKKGDITLWVGTSTDINDQKIFAQELEFQVLERTKELKVANINLQHSNEDLQQFASIASHDLQEPLRKIKTFTSILNRNFAKALPDQGKEIINKIKLSADRMSQLIKEVLEYSKVAHSSNDFVQADLNSILKNVLSDLDLLISDTGAMIHYEKKLPVIDANPLQMNQLFYNLLTNALKFYKETTPPEIRISYSHPSTEEIKKLTDLEENIPYIQIRFWDNGIGFEQRFADQIFQIFERLHSLDEFEGTGIGLALCKKIVETHHGHIFAVSDENDGTSFYIILPVRQ